MRANFDRVAKYYERLAHLMFGKTLINAQQCHFDLINTGAKVLILGGGTGELLNSEALSDAGHIDFLDSSKKMLERARRQPFTILNINFIHEDAMKWSGEYDVIICPFFLDCFKESALLGVLEKIKSMLLSDGKLLVTDFDTPKRVIDKAMLWAMIRFFRLTANLPTSRLLPIRSIIEDSGFKSATSKAFRKGFIFSEVYELADNNL